MYTLYVAFMATRGHLMDHVRAFFAVSVPRITI